MPLKTTRRGFPRRHPQARSQKSDLRPSAGPAGRRRGLPKRLEASGRPIPGWRPTSLWPFTRKRSAKTWRHAKRERFGCGELILEERRRRKKKELESFQRDCRFQADPSRIFWRQRSGMIGMLIKGTQEGPSPSGDSVPKSGGCFVCSTMILGGGGCEKLSPGLVNSGPRFSTSMVFWCPICETSSNRQRESLLGTTLKQIMKSGYLSDVKGHPCKVDTHSAALFYFGPKPQKHLAALLGNDWPFQ